MADVSHELGALRYVVDSSLSSKVAMFNNQAQQHKEAQLLNPFSTNNGRVSPKPTFSKDEYGKPLAGSLTEMRGQKANMHVLREMLELCQVISSEGYDVSDQPTMRVITFGELFNIYNYISDKVVGILLRARKHKLVEFEGEMLFQRRDDDVPIFLLKPIVDIRKELEAKIEDIKRSTSPAPLATSLLLHKEAHQQKLQEAALNAPSRKSVSRKSSPASSKAASPAPEAASPVKSSTPTPEAIVEEAAPTATAKVEIEQAEQVKAVTTAIIPEIKEPTVGEVTEKEEETKTSASLEHTDNAAAAKDSQNTVVQPEAQEATAPTLAPNDEHIIDANNNAANDAATTTTTPNENELPTIVIETSAVYVRGSGETPAVEIAAQQEQQPEAQQQNADAAAPNENAN